MFTFISFWRTAAVVLCDMSSTVYYIGAIVENAIGKAAPWFILAVLLFSYGDAGRLHRKLRAVRARRRVSDRERSAGRLLGQGGRVGAVVRLRAHRADQRRIGRAIHCRAGAGNGRRDCWASKSTTSMRDVIKSWGSVAIACAVTVYFLHQNLIGIHESSGKALQDHDGDDGDGRRSCSTWSGVTLGRARTGQSNSDLEA